MFGGNGELWGIIDLKISNSMLAYRNTSYVGVSHDLLLEVSLTKVVGHSRRLVQAYCSLYNFYSFNILSGL